VCAEYLVDRLALAGVVAVRKCLLDWRRRWFTLKTVMNSLSLFTAATASQRNFWRASDISDPYFLELKGIAASSSSGMS
jgi:hypothetical protein